MLTLKLTPILLLFTSAVLAETLHNSDVLRMVRAGRPVTEVVARINTGEPGFALNDEDVRSLREDGVPEIVIKAMFARQTGERLQLPDASGMQVPAEAARISVPPPTQPPVPQRQTLPSAESPAAPKTERPLPPAPLPHAQAIDEPEDYLAGGAKELNFSFTGFVPHASPSNTFGTLAARAGYYLTDRSLVGVDVEAFFQNQAQDVYLSGFYRHYQRAGSSKVYSFFGAGAGANIIHVSGYGTGNFLARGEGGIRVFVAPRIALDISYNLMYIHVRGAGFKDSSASVVGIGFSHAF